MKVRIIVITFENQIKPWEISKFRGAIIEKVGREYEWFHNHKNEGEDHVKFHYRYPLIQYRFFNGMAQLTCLQHGIEEIQRLFSQSNWTIRIGEKEEPLRIKSLDLKEVEVGFTEVPYNYQLQHWLPFNPPNYEYFQTLAFETDRIQFLEGILKGHILAFAQGVDWTIDAPLEVRVKKIVKQKFVSYKDAKMMSFNLDFQANVKLPFQAALGKGVSLGFGLLNRPSKTLRKRKIQKE